MSAGAGERVAELGGRGRAGAGAGEQAGPRGLRRGGADQGGAGAEGV